jgi:hypothetical protein
MFRSWILLAANALHTRHRDHDTLRRKLERKRLRSHSDEWMGASAGEAGKVTEMTWEGWLAWIVYAFVCARIAIWILDGPNRKAQKQSRVLSRRG